MWIALVELVERDVCGVTVSLRYSDDDVATDLLRVTARLRRFGMRLAELTTSWLAPGAEIGNNLADSYAKTKVSPISGHDVIRSYS